MAPVITNFLGNGTLLNFFLISNNLRSFIFIFIFRMNVSAGAARPNPQGSFRYGSINVTQVYVLRNMPPVTINGKRRTTLNGISYSNPSTPLRLADQYNKEGVYTLDFPTRPLDRSPRNGTSVINGTYKGFMEIIFQNNDTTVQTYHMDGYAFFVAGYFSTFCSYMSRIRKNSMSLFIYNMFDFYLTAGWTLESGQKRVEAPTTSGMEFLAVPHRCIS